jgi:hypothetical protein
MVSVPRTQPRRTRAPGLHTRALTAMASSPCLSPRAPSSPAAVQQVVAPLVIAELFQFLGSNQPRDAHSQPPLWTPQAVAVFIDTSAFFAVLNADEVVYRVTPFASMRICSTQR